MTDIDFMKVHWKVRKQFTSELSSNLKCYWLSDICSKPFAVHNTNFQYHREQLMTIPLIFLVGLEFFYIILFKSINRALAAAWNFLPLENTNS
jgi:hypothetical protein